jgi:hypothetical protein
MRSKLLPLFVVPSLLLGGCYVRLPISRAVAVAVSANEAAALNKRAAPSTPGEWFQVRVTITREAVRKIARWELYTHMKVEDCHTGDLVDVASSVGIEGTDGDFERMRQKLHAEEQRQTFVIAEPIFLPASKRLDRLCVRLEGGSYTLQKILSAPVPLHIERGDG